VKFVAAGESTGNTSATRVAVFGMGTDNQCPPIQKREFSGDVGLRKTIVHALQNLLASWRLDTATELRD